MDALGRVFNILPTADDVYVSLKDASAVTFVCVNTAGDTWTLTNATSAAGGSAAVLSTIDHYWVQTTNGAAWVKVTQAVGSAFTTSSSQDAAVVTVHESELADGMSWVKLASTSTGLVYAILHDLKTQRTPSNLTALV